MSDRKEFQSARDAGLKQRHEQRLARSAHYNEAVKAAAVAIGRTFNGDPLTWRAEAEAAVEAALLHLRAYQIELQTRIGYALGRKEAAEEIAVALESREDDARRAEKAEGIAGNKGAAQTWSDLATGYMRSAELAREIATKEAS